MAGCSLGTEYLLFALSPQAILAYVVEGLFGPLILFLYTRPKNKDGTRGRRRIYGLLNYISTFL